MGSIPSVPEVFALFDGTISGSIRHLRLHGIYDDDAHSPLGLLQRPQDLDNKKAKTCAMDLDDICSCLLDRVCTCISDNDLCHDWIPSRECGDGTVTQHV